MLRVVGYLSPGVDEEVAWTAAFLCASLVFPGPLVMIATRAELTRWHATNVIPGMR